MSHDTGQFVVAYHGCDQATADASLDGRLAGLDSSDNPYDWLGPGIYFFQDDWRRAWMFAVAAAAHPQRRFTARPVVTPAMA